MLDVSRRMSRSVIAFVLAIICIVFAACAPKPYAPKEVQAAAPPYQSDEEKSAVSRMKQAGIIAKDWRGHSRGICNLHGMKLETITVPRIDGEAYYEEEYHEARERFFPNAGILYGRDLFSEKEMGHIHVCPKCIAAAQIWNKEEG